MPNIKKILVLTAGSLGDSLCRIPAIRKIYQSNGESIIYVVTNMPLNTGAPSGKDIFLHLKFVSETFEYDSKASIWKKLIFFKKIRRDHQINEVYYLMPERTSYQKIRDLFFFYICGFYKTHGIKFFLNPKLAEWKRLLIMSGFNDSVGISDFMLDISEEDIVKSYEKFNIDDGYKLVVSLGTSKDWARWGLTSWKHILGRLYSEWGIKVVFIGSKNDYELTNILIKESKIEAINLCGKTSVLESYAILNKIGKFVGYDSGPMHLAVSANCEVVSIFSDHAAIGKWYPFGQENNVIRVEDGQVVANIKKEIVWEKLRQMISRS